ncbi:MAG TPA: MMPL family transporter [Pirellulales bacterium]|jgi:hypothetical protein|nr:MMPL family transporter [Pirellulales bacterium]
MPKTFFARFAVPILAGVLFVLPLVMLGSQLALHSNRNDVKEWLPSSFKETTEFEWFRKYFFNDTFILASWDGCTVQDERLVTLANKLVPPVLGMEVNLFGGKARVTKVIDGSSAATAGVQVGDIVSEIGRQPICAYADLASGLRYYHNGSDLRLAIVRDDESLELTVHVTEDLPTGPVLFEKVLTGRNVIEQLTAAPLNLTREEAIARMTGSVLGPDKRARRADGKLLHADEPDDRQTCALIILTKNGKENPRAAVAGVEQIAKESAVPAAALHLGGPPVDNVSIDKEGERMLFKLMILCGLVGWTLTYWCTRSFQFTTLIFNGSVYASSLSLAIVKYSGGTVNSILLTMPAVVYTAALSCGIHLVNYYRHTRASEGLDGAPGKGLKAAWLPCLLSAGTTSLGLISLYTSELVPIKFFGLYSAVGVMVTIVLMYLYLPSALQFRPPKVPVDPKTGREPTEALDPDHRRRMRWLGTLVTRRPAYVWIVFMTLLAVCGYGLRYSTTTISLMSLFSKNSEIIRSYTWLEKNLGPLVPMEVVVRMDPNLDPYESKGKLTLLQKMELIGRIQKSIESIPDVGSTMSALTFAPDILEKGGAGLGLAGRSKRSVLNKRLLAHRADLLKGDYYAEEDENGTELWRVSLRVAALNDIDYGAFIQSIKDKVEPVVKGEQAAGHLGLRNVVYTGLTPVVYKAQRALLDGLIESFFWAFVMIAAVMTVVFRDVRAGLYTMLPNVWPVAVVFGMMGWLGIPLDIGTMMTAGVAMGVCVDDTVHFANWFRRATRQGVPRREAVIMAYENSAGAIYQSTLIVSLGLATFSLSSFMPTQRFGMLMGTLLFFGLIADLVLTPAMLSGPIGRYFIRGCTPAAGLANGQPAERAASPLGHKLSGPHRPRADVLRPEPFRDGT